MAKKKHNKFKEVVSVQVPDRFSSYPSNGLTPRKLARILREADEGSLLSQSELFEEMEEKDTHLFSQLQTRKNSVCGLDFEIVAYSDDEADKQIAEFVKEQINDIEEIEEIFVDLLDAIGKGLSISEIVWDYSAIKNRYSIKYIKHHHAKNFFYDERDALKVYTKEYPSGIELEKDKFIVHTYKARSGHPARAGVLRVCAWMYLFKNYGLKDWVTFAEVYGMPIRLGKYDPSASEDDKTALITTLYQIASDAAGIMPSSADIEIKEASKTDSVEVFEKLCRYADEQISKAILGQTLTSDSGGGSYAQSKTHNEVRKDILVADCKALSATLRRDLIEPLVRFNFGSEANIPYLKFDMEDSEDLKALSEVLNTLVNDLGLKVPEEYVYKKFSIPQPNEGETILEGRKKEVSAIEMKAFKNDKKDIHAIYQEKIDRIADETIKTSGEVFQKIFTPVLGACDEVSTLEELKDKLQDESFVTELMEKMENPEMEDLLQRSMFLSDLCGRMIEHE